MSVVDFLRSTAQSADLDAERLASDIEEAEKELARLRDWHRAAILRKVETLAAATLLDNVGYRADWTDDGLPRVSIDDPNPTSASLEPKP